MAAADIARTVDTVFRMESARLVAGLTRLTRDVGLAEDLAQDALVAALESWPASGVPGNPGAWLMAAAKRRGIDVLRRRRRFAGKQERIARELDARRPTGPDPDALLDDDVGDDVLRLIFLVCHPMLPAEARVALALRLLCGLTTEEIARAYLVPEATIAQRIVRAKRTLAKERAPFEVPRGADRVARLGSVLEAVYVLFNEGYVA